MQRRTPSFCGPIFFRPQFDKKALTTSGSSGLPQAVVLKAMAMAGSPAAQFLPGWSGFAGDAMWLPKTKSEVAAPHRAMSFPAGADWVAGLSMAGLLLPEAVVFVPAYRCASAGRRGGVVCRLVGLLGVGQPPLCDCLVHLVVRRRAAGCHGVGAACHRRSPRHAMGVAMVLVAGVMLALAGMERLGAISQFIAKSGLRSFALGLALTLVVKQLPLALGLHPAHGDFLS
jgi:hypothetical protein